MKGAWHQAGPLADIRPGSIVARRLGSLEVAVCRLPEGIFAFEDRCPHAETRMSEGRLRRCRISCPLHGASFDVRDGRVLGGPAQAPLRTFPTRIESSVVEVWLPDPDAPPTA